LREGLGIKRIAIDGKTMRRSFDKASGKAALHLVSAWATAQHLVLGHGVRIFQSKEKDHFLARISTRKSLFQPLVKRLPRKLPLRPCFLSKHKARRRNKAMFSGLFPVRIRL